MNRKRSKSKIDRTMPMVHPNAAAIDIGATMHMAAVRADRTPEPVRSFGTFTIDLRRLVDWFIECGVETVVMESTSVYWIPIFELLDARGFTVFLVNARDAKHVPGRKTDVSDAQWLQRLHSYGLLRASFRPKGQIAELRAYVRQRERLLEYAASHIQHMQKALTEMNLQLHHVVADITGATGLRIIRAILAGEHDPKVLARLRDYRCHASAETIEKALTGSYRTEHLFALEQALTLYDAYHEKVSACDVRIEAVLRELSIGRGRRSDSVLSRRRPRTDQANGLAFDVRAHLSHTQPVEPPARGALNDLCSLELGKRAEHGQRQLVLRILLVVLAIDRNLLAVLEKLADDDPLVFNLASDAIGSEKINPVTPIGFHIRPHPIEGGPIEHYAGVPVVNVLFGEHVARDLDLSPQLHELAINGSFFLLRVGAHAGVQCGLRHTR
jgi:transposase